MLCDWLPWNHTAGGNHNFGLVLYNGGTFYIDEGRPLPGAFDTTVKNLREVATNWYFTVPKGYDALLPYFRADAELRNNEIDLDMGNPLVSRRPAPVTEYRRQGVRYVVTNSIAQSLYFHPQRGRATAFPSFARFYRELRAALLRGAG